MSYTSKCFVGWYVCWHGIASRRQVERQTQSSAGASLGFTLLCHKSLMYRSLVDRLARAHSKARKLIYAISNACCCLSITGHNCWSNQNEIRSSRTSSKLNEVSSDGILKREQRHGSLYTRLTLGCKLKQTQASICNIQPLKLAVRLHATKTRFLIFHPNDQ